VSLGVLLQVFGRCGVIRTDFYLIIDPYVDGFGDMELFLESTCRYYFLCVSLCLYIISTTTTTRLGRFVRAL
jgi:hypothetical protein